MIRGPFSSRVRPSLLELCVQHALLILDEGIAVVNSGFTTKGMGSLLYSYKCWGVIAEIAV